MFKTENEIPEVENRQIGYQSQIIFKIKIKFYPFLLL